METPENLRYSNPYRVPDGYFAALRGSLREAVSAAPVRPGLWQRVKGIAGLSAAFGCLVLLATTGYYFTGYQARQRERSAAQEESVEMFLAYHLYDEDLEELDEYAYEDSATQAEDLTLFTDAVTDYLDTYGYGSDLLAALTGIDTYW